MSNSAISIPFRFNEFGQVDATTDIRKIYQDRVLLTLLTRLGERVMRPNFGSLVGDALFENETTASEIVLSSIGTTFNTWLTDLSLIEATPFFDRNTGFMEVQVTYGLPSGESDTVKLKTAILNRSGDIIQEITSD